MQKHNTIQKIFLSILSLLFISAAFAQRPAGVNIGFKHYTAIRIDFKRGIFDPISVPFDVPFLIYGVIPPEVTAVHCVYNDKSLPSTTYTLKWARNIFNTSSTTNDTFYFVVNNPLKAIHEYEFRFKFFRAVTEAESIQLNTRSKPLFARYFEEMYEAAHSSGTSFDRALANALQNPADATIQELTTDLSNAIVKFYASKNIDVDPRQRIAENIIPFIRDNFFDPMLHKAVLSGNVDAITATSGTYTVVSTSKLLEKIHEVAAVLNLTQPVKDALRDTLRRGDVLDCLFNAKTNELEDAVTDPKVAATDISTRLAAIRRVEKVLVDFIRLSEDLHDDTTAIKKMRLTESEYKGGMNQLISAKLHAAQLGYYVSQYLEATNAFVTALNSSVMDFNFRFPIGVEVPGLTTADFITRGEWYITADLGFACAFIDNPSARIIPYFGANFNFFPINRQANYSLFKSIKKCDINYLLKGMSGIVGVTLIPFDIKDDYTDLLSTTTANTSLLTGIGIRITDGVRLSGGSMWSYRKNPNKLMDNKYLNASPYIAISLDWDLREFIKNITGRVPAFVNL